MQRASGQYARRSCAVTGVKSEELMTKVGAHSRHFWHVIAVLMISADAKQASRLNGADAWRARCRTHAGAKPGTSQSRALQGRRTHTVQTNGTGLPHRLAPALVQNSNKDLIQGSTGRFEDFLSPNFTSMDDKYVYRSAIVASFAAGYSPAGLDSSSLSHVLSGWTAVSPLPWMLATTPLACSMSVTHTTILV